MNDYGRRSRSPSRPDRVLVPGLRRPVDHLVHDPPEDMIAAVGGAPSGKLMCRAALLGLIALTIAGCGGATTTVTAGSQTTTSDINQRIADRFAESSGSLAKLCRQLPTVERTLGRQRAIQIGANHIGAYVIRQHGSPSEVVKNLLNRC
jgi:hypothetical protein